MWVLWLVFLSEVHFTSVSRFRSLYLARELDLLFGDLLATPTVCPRIQALQVCICSVSEWGHQATFIWPAQGFLRTSLCCTNHALNTSEGSPPGHSSISLPPPIFPLTGRVFAQLRRIGACQTEGGQLVQKEHSYHSCPSCDRLSQYYTLIQFTMCRTDTFPFSATLSWRQPICLLFSLSRWSI